MPLRGLPIRRRVMALCAVLTMGGLAACDKDAPQRDMAGMKVPVSVITVQPTPTEVHVELPGRVEAIKDAQIRARVTGIVKEINFVQGSLVKEGQLLFTIDPRSEERRVGKDT